METLSVSEKVVDGTTIKEAEITTTRKVSATLYLKSLEAQKKVLETRLAKVIADIAIIKK